MMLLSEEALSTTAMNPLSHEGSVSNMQHISEELRAEHRRLMMAKIE
jgi:hypothetical protein